MGRNANGEGTIYKRKDGRYEGRVWVTTVAGVRKRVSVFGKTRAEAYQKVVERIAGASAGERVPDRTWLLSEYVDYWLRDVAQTRKPNTYRQYALIARNHIRPLLGRYRLDTLTVQNVQAALLSRLAEGATLPTVHYMRVTLITLLRHAERHEFIGRNVARKTELPTYYRPERTPWSAQEAFRFLNEARSDPWYVAYALILFYGLRHAEALGLTWDDIDFSARTIHVHRQLQYASRRFTLQPVKTRSGDRVLPLLPHIREVLQTLPRPQTGLGTVVTNRDGKPALSNGVLRRFHRIRKAAGLRYVTIHDLRHTTATLLKDAQVPARDAQAILGHANVSTTMQIYQHSDAASRSSALDKVERLLGGGVGVKMVVNDPKGVGPRVAATTVDWASRSTWSLPEFYSNWLCMESNAFSVLRLARTHANIRLLGCVGVRSGRQIDDSITEARYLVLWAESERVREAMSLLGSLQKRRDTYPLNLLKARQVRMSWPTTGPITPGGIDEGTASDRRGPDSQWKSAA
ncbi:tyrosine-type recombinase/integrase [Luteipulveratus mongoliensis]|uniref:tyrosine-type recombinase/integrase n=1 Tax=Luteipulveratus mongoliensis TaxID=571913 RepID=UPI0009FB6B36|nr:site-specific integrase [Luteipulveratus mongoliensis]